jgi:hypothetical protein
LDLVDCGPWTVDDYPQLNKALYKLLAK